VIFSAVDREFEADGYPLALSEQGEDLFEVSLYADEAEQYVILERLARITGMKAASVGIEILADIDWVRHSLDGLKPVRAGRFFVHGSHDRDKLTSGVLGIEIDAACAFGTGHHGTTAGCLEMISKLMPVYRPRRILDLGTGSGVLAIAMAKLVSSPGTSRILASDNDQIAVDIARENMLINRTGSAVQLVTATGFHHRLLRQNAPYDLIVANILARPLMSMAPLMARALTGNGSIILSGILGRQREAVLAAFRNQGLFHRRSLHREGWVTLFLRKSGAK